MTEQETEQLLAMMKPAQRLHHKLHDRLIAEGVEPVEVMLVALQAAQMRASMVLGGAIPAIEWIRTAVDMWERELLAEANANARR